MPYPSVSARFRNACMKTLVTALCGGTALVAVVAPLSATPPLLDRIDRVIGKVRGYELRSDRDSPWVIMHAVIALKTDVEVNVVDRDRHQPVNAIRYLLTQAQWDGTRIFRATAGRPWLPTRDITPGFHQSYLIQDHVNQYLCALADANVPLNEKLIAEGDREFTVGDLLAACQYNFRPEQELGWTLVCLAHYTPVDEPWPASDGRSWTLADLVTLATDRDVQHETEGGPHHLYGVAYALQGWRNAHPGRSADGAWRLAEEYLERHIDVTRQYQQDDGELSAGMYNRGEPSSHPAQLVHATGHTLEWLTRALAPHRLQAGWVTRAVERLVREMERAPLQELTPGGTYHAVHALRRYREIAAAWQTPHKVRSTAPTSPPAGFAGWDGKGGR
ncbi:MAG: hypothetical protein GTO53_09095 [Planctomycetales bacterium]|nr:hypothetical protein [Planctomycetales bacterium]NIM09282.1 hypothetical protein [Planctomycetales bacterium]NIN08750.1 hypothetical protein [Planctomycetales bacterium]NIN77869.1 hypothetical protein [Planctomycetales bacterium]NIO35052.1 hypothetical protein [Planctomycetales bacterium]